MVLWGGALVSAIMKGDSEIWLREIGRGGERGEGEQGNEGGGAV